jgi:hypothetical protein
MTRRRHTRPERQFSVERLEDRSVPAANYWAVGSAAGVPATARLLDPSGAERFNVTPFGLDFSGGVRAAVGDLTADGVPDLVTAAGAGGGPRVVGYDGATGRQLTGPLGSFFAFDPAFTGGLSVAVADLNRDGFADLVAAAGPGGGPHVKAFDGKTGQEVASFFAYDAAFRGGAGVTAADLDGDDRAEIVTGAGPGGGPHVKTFGADGVRRAEFFAYEPSFRGGVRVTAGDLDGDTEAEIVTGAGAGGGPAVRVFDGTTGGGVGGFMAGDAAGRAGVEVGVRHLDRTASALVCALVGDRVQDFDGRTFAAVGSGTRVGAGAAIGSACTLDGDTVQDWVSTLLQTVWRTNTPPPAGSRAMAMVGVAVYDAVNSIIGEFQPYRSRFTASPTASAEAAAAVAAARTLQGLFPALADQFRAKLDASLAAIPDGPAKSEGVAVGEMAAASVLAWRADDGAARTVTYTPGTEPGDWRPTLPRNAPALAPQWPQLVPFAMTRGDQFRAAGPPDLTRAEYTAAFNEVKALGRRDESTRTAEQTQIGLFWADNAGVSPTPPGHWLDIALRESKHRGLTLSENARLFAMLGVALADAAIVSWDAKFDDDFWRPITAIREADTDGNPATVADSDWLPLIPTPPFPSYTSGHSTFSAAAAAVLGAVFGADTPFSTSSADLPGVVRSFASYEAAADEAARSRLYGGIHYSFDNNDGITTGRALGEYVVTNFFRPA